MPIKQLRRGCLNPGSGDEQIRPRHIFHAVLPAHVAHAAFRNREANRATGETPRATRKTVAATQFNSCRFLVGMNAPASALTSSRFLLHHVLKIRSPHHRIFRPRQLCAVSSKLFRAIQRRIRQSQNSLPAALAKLSRRETPGTSPLPLAPLRLAPRSSAAVLPQTPVTHCSGAPDPIGFPKRRPFALPPAGHPALRVGGSHTSNRSSSNHADARSKRSRRIHTNIPVISGMAGPSRSRPQPEGGINVSIGTHRTVVTRC